MQKRQQVNKQLVDLLAVLVDSYPSLRFSQILANFEFVKTEHDSRGYASWNDEYYAEPEIVHKRVSEAVQRILNGK